MKTGIIIQARVGSSRLPGKIFLKLGSTFVLDWVISRCKSMQLPVIVATSDKPEDKLIIDWCENNQIKWFSGSSENVLERYFECAKKYNLDRIIRVTSDCPFVDIRQIALILDSFNQNERLDLVYFSENQPRGLTSEGISFQALSICHEQGFESSHREHVTTYAYDHLDQFHYVELSPPEELVNRSERLTLDVMEDFVVLSQIVNHANLAIDVGVQKIMEFVSKNQSICEFNRGVIQKK